MPRPLQIPVALLCLAAALPGPEAGADEITPAFQAVVAVKGAANDKVREHSLAKSLKRRAKALGFSIRIEGGPADDQRLTIMFYPDGEAIAREQLDQLVKGPRIELREVHPQNASFAAKVQDGGKPPEGWQVYEFRYEDDDSNENIEKLLLADATVLETTHIEEAWPDKARAGVINVKLTAQGGELMKRLTEPMAKGRDRVAILFNGKVNCAPIVQDVLTTNFIIQGIDDNQKRRALAASMARPLDVPLEVESFRAAP